MNTGIKSLLLLTVAGAVLSGCQQGGNDTPEPTAKETTTGAGAETPAGANGGTTTGDATTGTGGGTLSPNSTKAVNQVKTLISNVKNWQAQGNDLKTINLQKAKAAGLIPKEMINNKGVVFNPWVGTVDVSPFSNGKAVVVTFSGVPKEGCVEIASPGEDAYEVYAGKFLPQNRPKSREDAEKFCTTRNVWFVSK